MFSKKKLNIINLYGVIGDTEALTLWDWDDLANPDNPRIFNEGTNRHAMVGSVVFDKNMNRYMYVKIYTNPADPNATIINAGNTIPRPSYESNSPLIDNKERFGTILLGDGLDEQCGVVLTNTRINAGTSGRGYYYTYIKLLETGIYSQRGGGFNFPIVYRQVNGQYGWDGIDVLDVVGVDPADMIDVLGAGTTVKIGDEVVFKDGNMNGTIVGWGHPVERGKRVFERGKKYIFKQRRDEGDIALVLLQSVDGVPSIVKDSQSGQIVLRQDPILLKDNINSAWKLTPGTGEEPRYNTLELMPGSARGHLYALDPRTDIAIRTLTLDPYNYFNPEIFQLLSAGDLLFIYHVDDNGHPVFENIRVEAYRYIGPHNVEIDYSNPTPIVSGLLGNHGVSASGNIHMLSSDSSVSITTNYDSELGRWYCDLSTRDTAPGPYGTVRSVNAVLPDDGGDVALGAQSIPGNIEGSESTSVQNWLTTFKNNISTIINEINGLESSIVKNNRCITFIPLRIQSPSLAYATALRYDIADWNAPIFTRLSRVQLENQYGAGANNAYDNLSPGDKVMAFAVIEAAGMTVPSFIYPVEFIITGKTSEGNYTTSPLNWISESTDGSGNYTIQPMFVSNFVDFTGTFEELSGIVRSIAPSTWESKVNQANNIELTLDPNIFTKSVTYYKLTPEGREVDDYGLYLTNVNYTLDNTTGTNKPYIRKLNNMQGDVKIQAAIGSKIQVDTNTETGTITLSERSEVPHYSIPDRSAGGLLMDVDFENRIAKVKVMDAATGEHILPQLMTGDILDAWWTGDYNSSEVIDPPRYVSIQFLKDTVEGDGGFSWDAVGDYTDTAATFETDPTPERTVTSLNDLDGEIILDTGKKLNLTKNQQTLTMDTSSCTNFKLTPASETHGRVVVDNADPDKPTWRLTFSASEIEGSTNLKELVESMKATAQDGDMISLWTNKVDGDKSTLIYITLVIVTFSINIYGTMTLRGYPTYINNGDVQDAVVTSLNQHTGDMTIQGWPEGIEVHSGPGYVTLNNTGGIIFETGIQDWKKVASDPAIVVGAVYSPPTGYPHDNSRDITLINGGPNNNPNENARNESFLASLRANGIRGGILRGTLACVDTNGKAIRTYYAVVSIATIITDSQGNDVGISGTQIFPDDTKAEWNDMAPTSINGASGQVNLTGTIRMTDTNTLATAISQIGNDSAFKIDLPNWDSLVNNCYYLINQYFIKDNHTIQFKDQYNNNIYGDELYNQITDTDGTHTTKSCLGVIIQCTVQVTDGTTGKVWAMLHIGGPYGYDSTDTPSTSSYLFIYWGGQAPTRTYPGLIELPGIPSGSFVYGNRLWLEVYSPYNWPAGTMIAYPNWNGGASGYAYITTGQWDWTKCLCYCVRLVLSGEAAELDLKPLDKVPELKT
jgi:hypothetical protein